MLSRAGYLDRSSQWRALTSTAIGPYAVAVIVTAAAFAAKMALPAYLGPPYILLYPAVMLAATIGGLGPGLLSTAISAILAVGWILPAETRSGPLSSRDAVSLVTFTTMGVFMSAVAALYRRARHRVAQYERGLALREAEERSRRREEEALRRYQLLADNSRDVILFVRRDDGRILEANAAATAAYGYARDELVGLTIQELRAPGSRESVARQLADADARGLRFETVHRRKDGTTFPVEVSAQGTTVDGARTLVSVVRDITERRSSEEALRESEERFRQAQKLESIGRLAGGVAHDFNNLLTVILSCAESLGEEARGGAAASLEELQEIQAAARRARDLTRQLLAFARKQVIAPVALDLNDVVRGSEKLLRRVLGEDVALAVTLQPGLWRARCDPGQLEQVILNLAVNARDAMPRGGALTIQTGNVRLSEGLAALHPEERPGEYVQMAVGDSGVGMSEEVKSHLFEPFFTTKPAGQGTGLGLATVYGIVTQSGGHIRVHSEAGRGSLFELFFPRTLEAVAPLPPPSPSPSATRGSESILVVEDDPQVRDVTLRALRAGGYRVVVAASPRSALLLPAAELDGLRLLVTDVVMPELDGRALAEELRRRHPDLRVLYVSGYPRDAIAERGVLDAGVELLEKPFTGPSLLAKVRAVLDAR